ncbi:MAG: paiB [Chloroflexi bacterium]|nr:paiB [Chloroflexota bacterium]
MATQAGAHARRAEGCAPFAYDRRVLYQPGHRKFEVEDPAALLEELCGHVPGTLVTHTADGFRATILPMLFDPGDGPFGTLRGHLARGNPQWRDIGPESHGLAIFDGPDAYVSPTWYAEKRLTGKVVPTWNYITVQAQGVLRLRHEPEWLLAHVRRLVDRHERLLPDPWSLDDAPDGYKETQVRAIVGLELRIDRLEAKRKLSQNRSDADIAGTIGGLVAGGPGEQAVAASMAEQTSGTTDAGRPGSPSRHRTGLRARGATLREA